MPNQKDSEADIQGIVFPNGKLEPQEKEEFREVLELWSVLARRYANRWGRTAGTWKEVHWCYRERAQVGLFASAVWMAGGVALEEYGSEKTAFSDARVAKYKGRTDLCFSLRSPDRSYVVEAKHVAGNLPRGQMGEEQLTPIRDGLCDACEDARDVTDDGEKLGMVFVTLDLAGGEQGRAIVTQSIRKWVAAVNSDKRFKKCLVISWLFPFEAQLLTDGKATGKPGTAVFVASASSFK